MSRTTDLLRLACEECWWVPEPDQPMQVVKDHFDNEHEGREVRLELAAFCLRDGLHMPDSIVILIDSERARYEHTCGKCHRTYGYIANAPVQS